MFLLLFSCCVFMYSETNEPYQKFQEKSVIGGVLLGGIGIAGIYIPGTFGWGNFYAEDYLGFWILNIGGSICTLCTWAEAFRLVQTTGTNFTAKDMSALAYIGVLGSLGFGVASLIMGGTSVDRYNYLNRPKNLSFLLLPKYDGCEMTLVYNF